VICKADYAIYQAVTKVNA